ncbi:MAG: ABC transporter permease, partial [Gaiellaceae bacterium]
MTTTPAAVQPVPRGGMARLVGRRITDWIPAAVVLVGMLALWEGLIRALDVQAFLLPKPSEIARTLWDTRHEL